MKAIDLFCCAGGATQGLQQAGFETHGVDITKQPRYPGVFWHADALRFPLGGYDFIWASPPCQGYTVLRHAPGARGAPRLIGAVRDRLKAAGAPYCIENVEEARADMHNPVMLCGRKAVGCNGAGFSSARSLSSRLPAPAPTIQDPSSASMAATRVAGRPPQAGAARRTCGRAGTKRRPLRLWGSTG